MKRITFLTNGIMLIIFFMIMAFTNAANSQATSKKLNLKVTSQPSAKSGYIEINNDEHNINPALSRNITFFKAGGLSTVYKLTSLEIDSMIIPLTSDTLVLSPNKYFELPTKNYGKFVIRINQNNLDLNGGIDVKLWVQKKYMQSILKK